MRSATVRAARRRGWVCPIAPRTPRPRSRQIFGSWVVLPEPVSPATTTTWWSRMVASRAWRRALHGQPGGGPQVVAAGADRQLGRVADGRDRAPSAGDPRLGGLDLARDAREAAVVAAQ